MNIISDIYFLASGVKTELELDISESLSEIYNEAYQHNVFIEVFKTNVYKVVIAKKHTPTIVATQLVYTLDHGDEYLLTYRGDANPTSTRTAAYGIAKNLGININIRIIVNELVITKPIVDTTAITNALDNMIDTVEIPLNAHSSLARLRAVISAHGKRHNQRYKTRVAGDKLIVQLSAIEPTEQVIKATTAHFGLWLAGVPYDTPTPIPVMYLEAVSAENRRVIAHRTCGCSVSLKAGATLAVRKSLAKGFENGQCVVRLNGHIIYTGLNYDVSVINDALKWHNLKFEDIP